MACALVPAALAVEANLTPAKSNNKHNQTYVISQRYNDPAYSYLYVNESGGLTRVEYIKGQVVVEDYDDQFQLVASRIIPWELPIWGGFYAGETYNFLVFGQANTAEDNEREVLRVVKYTRDWERLDECSVYGANTYRPFSFGTLRCAEKDGYLYLHTCHEMYQSSDGLRHQANMTFNIRQSDMEMTDYLYRVANESYGYVSHSFDQFILVDSQGSLLTLNLGDAYPRGISLFRYSASAGQDDLFVRKGTSLLTGTYGEHAVVRKIGGQIGDNDTGVALGGFVELPAGYLISYTQDGTTHLTSVDRWTLEAVDWTFGKTAAPSNPQLVATGPDEGYVLWQYMRNFNSISDSASTDQKVYYGKYNFSGKLVGGEDGIQVSACDAELSDCQPIVWNGKVVWYVTDSTAPTFYTLDDSGVTAHQASVPGVSNIAYASTQTVLVDGEPVTFLTYALKDAKGNQANYIRARDLAYHLNGTQAMFHVDWSQEKGTQLYVFTYYTPNGTELTTPFTGDRPYQQTPGKVVVNSWRPGDPIMKDVDLDAILLKDNAGGGYTYFKLRDLGEALGFNVGWNGKSVYIETDQPYDPGN